MGIDAEMFVRTRKPLTPRQIRNLSVDLCEAFGQEPFLLMPGWTIAEDEDPEYPTTEWWEAGDPIGRHALRRIKWWQQDGPDIKPRKGEQFIAVSLMSRFYGEGYERGPIHLHCAIAAWLESRIDGGEVWYGGDSSGCVASKFDGLARASILAHFHQHGHRPYTGGFSGFGSGTLRAPACGFCGPSMKSNGGGPDVTFYWCAGCGAQLAQDGTTGAVEVVDKQKHGRDDDVFKAGNRLRRTA